MQADDSQHLGVDAEYLDGNQNLLNPHDKGSFAPSPEKLE